MKKAFIHTTIWKEDATAILVEDGIIQKVGTDEEILKEVEKEDEVVDLQGAFLTPGFIDTHLHMLNYGYALSIVSLNDCICVEDIVNKIQEKLPSIEKGSWLVARGYDESTYPDQVGPTKKVLDAISEDVAIITVRACGHELVANSKAFELAEITESYNEEDGSIDLQTGRVTESCLSRIYDARPKPTSRELKEYLHAAMKKVNSFGITGVCSDDFVSLTENYEVPLEVFLQESYQGNLTVRFNEQCEFRTPEDLAHFLDEGYTTGVGDDFFEIGPLKMILDGSLGAHTASVTKPYIDVDTTGKLIYTDDELETYVHLANTYNMPTISHAIGDNALDQALRIYEKEILPGNPLGYGIVHCQLMRQDQIDKVLAMQLHCYFQSLFIDADALTLKERVSEELQKTSYPYKTLFENTLSANGSDAPVETPNVLKGIYLAVTRKSIKTSDEMEQSECLTVEEALSSYTEKGAKIMGHEDTRGKIQEGYVADFVIMDKDITKCPVEDILSTNIVMTVMNGEEVYH